MGHDFELHDLLLRRSLGTRRRRLPARTRPARSASTDRNLERTDDDLGLGSPWFWLDPGLRKAALWDDRRGALGSDCRFSDCDYIRDEFFS
jgi:hypothetical protein